MGNDAGTKTTPEYEAIVNQFISQCENLEKSFSITCIHEPTCSYTGVLSNTSGIIMNVDLCLQACLMNGFKYAGIKTFVFFSFYKFTF